VDVYHAGSGKVREEWLSRCREERALTTEMMDEILDLSNLTVALQRVISNQGSSGVDGMGVEELKVWFSQHYKTLRTEIYSNEYRVSPIRGVKIPKGKGGYRQLGIPTVIDRLVQQSIHQVLERYYDPRFSKQSYGFRRGKGTHRCLESASSIVGSGYSYIVDIDLAKFFDEVNHDRLIRRLSERIGDKRVIRLIGKYLRSGLMEGGLNQQRTKGTPQGSPLSPLLSNIVLDELDKELERRGLKFVRYADDMIIFTKSVKSAERVKESITRFIEDKLKLRVNTDKSGIRRPYELNFLGHSLMYNGTLGLSKESEQRLRNKLKEETRRNRGMSLEQLVKKLNPILRGWLNYFGGARMKKKLQNIMSWLRRRIRCFRLKQCKRAIGISRFLRRLGVPEWRSWLIALSSKGWYHKSNTPQAHEGMNNLWFARLGLFDMYTYYCSKLMKPPST
jgi:group II intron reverse transcriptase/maturase